MPLATSNTINFPAYNLYGPLGQPTSSGANALSRAADVISLVIGLVTIVGGLWFAFQLIFAAFSWITAGADKDALQRAQKKMQNAFIGLILLVFSYTIISLVANLFGLDIFRIDQVIVNMVG